MIWYIPLEYLDKRYTILMDKQLKESFAKYQLSYETINGEDLTGGIISTGAFLDSDGTNYFKFSQLQDICRKFKDGIIKNGDVFFVSDLWFPGLVSIPYMAMFHKIKVKICGIFHAGSWTTTDYVAQLKDWAHDVEVGWYKMVDKVFVGSQFHKREILRTEVCTDPRKIIVTGLPYSVYDVRTPERDVLCKNKEDIVILSGRLDDEKHPEVFDAIEKLVHRTDPQAQFIKTMPLNLTKDKYFDLLARSKVIFSAAEQENYGYGILEGVTLSNSPVVPNDLSYVEMYPKIFRYECFDEAYGLVMRYLKNPVDISFVADYYTGSSDRIVQEIGGLV